MNTCSLETRTAELFLKKAQIYHHELSFNFADHCWNDIDVLELKTFVFQYLHPGAFLNAHFSFFIYTAEQFFKISFRALRDLSKHAEGTPSFLLAAFVPVNAQQVLRAGYQQLPSRPILLQPSLTHVTLLTWNCCSWTQHLDSLHGLGCGNRGCSCYRRCHATMAVFLQMALPCLESDLEYGNTRYKRLGVFSNTACVNLNSMMGWQNEDKENHVGFSFTKQKKKSHWYKPYGYFQLK